MKKGLFLILAVLTLGFVRVSADIAAPVLNDKVIKIEIREGADPTKVKEAIDKVDGVFNSQIIEPSQCQTCQTCEKCETCSKTSDSLSDKDIESLKNATLIIYVTLGILVVLMIIVIALMITRRKKDSKKDA